MLIRQAVVAAAGARLSVRQVELPSDLAGTDVLVAMLRAPINPADLLVIDGRYAFDQDYPIALGAEGVGEVLAVGASMTTLAPGMRVLPLSRGNWATHRIIPEHQLVPVPASLPLAAAAVARINPATAWHLLAEADAAGLIRADRPVLINGGTSMVASLVAHFGRRRGIDVIRIGRRAEPGVITEAELAATCAHAAGRPLLAFDCVAGPATGQLAAQIDHGGAVIVFGHLSGEPCQVPSALLTGRGLTVRGFSLRPAEAKLTAKELQGVFAAILGELATAPEPGIAATYRIDALDEALAAARSSPKGRVMLALDDG